MNWLTDRRNQRASSTRMTGDTDKWFVVLSTHETYMPRRVCKQYTSATLSPECTFLRVNQRINVLVSTNSARKQITVCGPASTASERIGNTVAVSVASNTPLCVILFCILFYTVLSLNCLVLHADDAMRTFFSGGCTATQFYFMNRKCMRTSDLSYWPICDP